MFFAASRLQTGALELSLSLPQTVFELSYCTLCDCPPFRLKSIRASSTIHNYYYDRYWSNTMSYYSNINGNVLLKSTRIYRYRKWSDEGIFLTVLLQICPLGIRFRKGIRSSQRTISQKCRLRWAKIYIISV